MNLNSIKRMIWQSEEKKNNSSSAVVKKDQCNYKLLINRTYLPDYYSFYFGYD